MPALISTNKRRKKNTMNEQKQNEALAKHEGYKFERQTINPDIQIWRDLHGHLRSSEVLPDYNDERNLLRIVRGLSEIQLWVYVDKLEMIMYRDHRPASLCDSFDAASLAHQAEAPQLREALLKATGGWEDE